MNLYAFIGSFFYFSILIFQNFLDVDPKINPLMPKIIKTIASKIAKISGKIKIITPAIKASKELNLIVFMNSFLGVIIVTPL